MFEPEKIPTNDPVKPKEIPKDAFDPHFQEHPEDVTENHLNNFFFNLPGGDYRNLDYFKNNIQRTYKEIDTETSNYSEKKLNQTIGEFFDTVDKATEECVKEKRLKSTDDFSVSGIESIHKSIKDLRESARAINKQEESQDKREMAELQMDLQRKLLEISLPIYRKLRKWGYNHNELIS